MESVPGRPDIEAGQIQSSLQPAEQKGMRKKAGWPHLQLPRQDLGGV